MIVWSGFGFLAFIIGALGFIIGSALQTPLDASGLGLPHGAGLAIGLLVAAAVNWVVGQKLNGNPGREMIDAKTGQRVVFRRRNSLFWIPMQYVSVLLILAAVAAVFGVFDMPAALPTDAQPT